MHLLVTLWPFRRLSPLRTPRAGAGEAVVPQGGLALLVGHALVNIGQKYFLPGCNVALSEDGGSTIRINALALEACALGAQLWFRQLCRA